MVMGKSNKIIVLIADGCGACSQVEAELSGNSQFELMDVHTNPEARKLVKELGITGVPTFLYSDRKGKICSLNEDGKIDKCTKESRHDKK